jgi:hypothetical protein
MAYVSEEGGRPEIYIQTFPDPSLGRWLASGPEGGERPVWRADSLRLYYWAPAGRFTSVSLKRGRVLTEPGHPVTLFDAPAGEPVPFAVTLDERVLMAVSRSRPMPP